MIGTEEITFEPEPVTLSFAGEFELHALHSEADKKLNMELWKDERGPMGKAYLRPPGRPDLSYKEVGEIQEEHRDFWSRVWDQAREPKSRVLITKNAWAWDLKKFRGKMDEFAKQLLQKSDLYLCRHVMSLVEQENEKITLATIDLSNADSVIYRMWPTEAFKSRSTLDVDAKLSAKIGLTQTLDIIELPLSGGATVVWQGKWEWVSAIIKAWGVGDSSAGWELSRDSSAPFSGDRELYLMLQVPKGEKPKHALATLEVKINPGILARSFVYHTKDPVDVVYHVA